MPCVNTILRHKTCYSEEIIQKDLSKTGAFTEKNPQTGDFKNNSGYFPTNFVVQDDLLYYVDYECNHYMDEWNLENWGIKYWSRTPEFEEYLQTHI